MYFGSKTSDDPIKTPIAANFDNSDFSVTSDQVSEYYTVANIASTVTLPSAQTINENFVTISNIYETTGTTGTSSTTVVEKPTVIDVSGLSRSIISYVVQEGDTFDNINLHGATKTQVRWSNGLKKEELTVGTTIYIPNGNGIVYKVKANETLDSIVNKTSSNKANVILLNDIIDEKISTDQLLFLPGGSLPEKERPEYVAPTPRPVASPSRPGNTSSYVRDTADRHGRFEIGSYGYWSGVYNSTRWQGNPGAFGNCTWFVWYWRRNNLGSNYWLPGGRLGNARDWINSLSGQFYTGRTPAYGAVMQSTSGRYGHVAVVVGVVEGQYITIQEMNYQGYNRVFQSTISWSDAINYNYIYGHK